MTKFLHYNGLRFFSWIAILVAGITIIGLPHLSLAQEVDHHPATIQLKFTQTDSTRTCTALVMSDTVPVPGMTVHFYIDRTYSPLPVGEAETDESGTATAEFPIDLPGDKNNMLAVIARIEEDDTYGDVETRANIKWGVIPADRHDHWSERSLSASRDRAPMYLIIASNSIIAVIWGTLFYIIFQLFKIRKAGSLKP